MTEAEKAAYARGWQDGVTCYAHWKNGVQYVGTCGRTMEEALKFREGDYNYAQEAMYGTSHN